MTIISMADKNDREQSATQRRIYGIPLARTCPCAVVRQLPWILLGDGPVKLYCDTANLPEIERALSWGFVQGITTNPSHVRKEVAAAPLGHLRRIAESIDRAGVDAQLHVQGMSTDPAELERQTRVLVDEVSCKSLVVKIPCTWDNMPVIRSLAKDGIQVNCTAIMTAGQALVAANAGARYISLFAGKMSDAGMNPTATIAAAAPLVGECGSEVIVGSIRRAYDIIDFALAGAHIVTAPERFLRLIVDHPTSAQALAMFAADFLPLT